MHIHKHAYMPPVSREAPVQPCRRLDQARTHAPAWLRRRGPADCSALPTGGMQACVCICICALISAGPLWATRLRRILFQSNNFTSFNQSNLIFL